MHERHRKGKSRTLHCPNALAEEIDLPERIGMSLQKLAPGTLPTLGARIETVF